MTGLIHLVRHGTHAEVGRVLSGRSEIALDARGRADAAAAAALLADEPVRSIHASPRARTLQTAAPIARALGLEPTIAPALDEIDFGRFAGRAFAELDDDPNWRRWNAERGEARCPGGETMAEAVTRACDYLFAIPAAATPAVCVTHCDIIRGVVARLIGLPPARIFALDCDPGSVTTLAIGSDGTRLAGLNRPARRSAAG